MNKYLKTLFAAFAVAAISLLSTHEVNAQSPQFWWPEQLDLTPLRQQSPESNPMGAKFDYAKEFAKLDLNAVKADIKKTLTTSQPWWPADGRRRGRRRLRQIRHDRLDGRQLVAA